MRKAVIQNRMALDVLTAAQGGMRAIIKIQCCVSSVRPHELQHTRPPCPSPTPGVSPNSCPLSRDAI